MMRPDRILGAALAALSLTVFAVLTILAVRRPAPPKSPPGKGAGQAAAETEKSAAEDNAGLSDDTAHLETRRPVPVGLPKPTIPGSLAEAFDESRGLIDRMKAVDILRGNRTPGEFAAIRWLLRKSDEDEALRNSAARKLLEWGDERLAADLTGMAWDEKETPKWRNYCIQFLKDCYDRDRDPAILDTLFKAAEADEKMVRICAVWSLARIATPRDRGKLPDEEVLGRIRAVGLEALRGKDADFMIRTAGVQSCARLGMKEALPNIRELARDDATQPRHLRVVSTAALGDLGNETDLALLDGLAASAKGQLRSAAAHAAKKVRARTAERKPAAGEGDTPPAEVPKDADGRRDF